MRTVRLYKYILCLLSLGPISCGKSFLDVKPSQQQRVPTTIADFQGLLDFKNIMNRFSPDRLGILGADEFFVPDEMWVNFPIDVQYHNFQKNAYFWTKKVYEGGEVDTDWSEGYFRILRTNVVLDGLKKINAGRDEQEAYNNCKGGALFLRALRYYALAQLYCKTYDRSTADQDLGLPLFLEADVTLKIPRATLAATYNQIIADLEEAIPLLPEKPLVLFRASKISVEALLARIYLQMEDYPKALESASSALEMNHALLDYNSLDPNEWYPFQAFGEGNPEIIFMDMVAGTELLDNYDIYFNVDSSLLKSYLPGDLRKPILFYQEGERNLFRGSYGGDNGFFFTGLATDELYLISAEAASRLGQVDLAISQLNLLLMNRYTKQGFAPIGNLLGDQLLTTILQERRKELPFRGLRWDDLRRLNKDPLLAKTISRVSQGKKYQLPPGDVRWVWPLPVEAVTAGGYEQNDR